ncbi:MAG: PucR family transcriptional regulator ligand-binding domain-containing protein [Firmicutes bacterium]|nr:PucR family transcriptional regulator ligand-binding domain-containing protein [Bacillota bacterium]
MQVVDLLKLDKKFKDIHVIAGKKGLSRVIKDIEILEIPDGVYWLEEGDFIITTGYIFQNNQADLYNTIEIISKKGAGIGIKTGRFIKKISAEVIALADKLNFPILEIPVQLGYSDFIWPIVSKLLNDKSYTTFVFEQFHDNLTAIVNRGFSIDHILHLLKNYIDLPVVLLSKHYKLIKCITDTSDSTDNLPIDTIIKAIDDNTEHIRSMNSPFVYENEGHTYHIFPIRSPKQLLGYLCTIGCTSPKGSNCLNTLLIDEVIPYVIIWMISNNKNNIYYRSKKDLLLDLIYGNYTNDIDIINETKYLGLDIDMKSLLWIMRLSETKTTYDPDKNANIQTVHHFLVKQYPDNIFLTDKNKILCIHPVPHEDQVLTSCGFEDLLTDMKEKFPQYEFKIGVSTPYKSLLDIKYAYQEARTCIELGTQIGGLASNLYFYKDLTAYHLVYEFASHPLMIKLYDNTIKKLASFDLKHKSELIRTLSTFIYCDFNIRKTAENLFVHRNTLYKRLEKIDEITTYNLNSNEGKLILSLALKLHEIKSM